jgi:DNA modification methylase
VGKQKPLSFGEYALVAPDALKAYGRNPRTHPDSQIAQIVASITAFGFTNPLLIDEADNIIAGHGRLDAAKRLGLASVPCIRLKGLSEAQKRALVIADNQIALNAGWDLELLSGEIKGLSDVGFDLDLIGFSADELDRYLAPGGTQGLTDPDEVPDAPENPVSQPGDIWLLGRHRLVCGDCTDAAIVDKALAGIAPHLMVTDPPYGVEYDAGWREKYDLNIGKRIGGQYSGRATGKVDNDDRSDWREAWALFPGAVAYVWHGGLHSATVQNSLEATGFKMRAQIIWAKQHFVFGRGDYHWQHEPCWYAVRSTGGWAGDRKQTTLWQINNNNPFGNAGKTEEKTNHSTQKPVECMKRPIENNSSPGQAVYEPFSGSGTTIIAAEMTGRACHGIELNPAYVDVAITRWQNFTGQTAQRDNGEPFRSLATAPLAAA